MTIPLRVMKARYHYSIFVKIIPYLDLKKLKFTNHHSVGLISLVLQMTQVCVTFDQIAMYYTLVLQMTM